MPEKIRFRQPPRKRMLKNILKEKIRNLIFPIKSRYTRYLWEIKYRTTHKNHVIKIRSLKPGRHEFDTKILHASFQLLVDFVEKDWVVKTREQLEEKYILKEKDLLNDDGKIDDVRVKQNEESYEIFNLYCWWKHERPKRKDHYEELLKKHPREKKFQHIPIEWDEEGEPTLYRWDSGMSSEFAEDMRKVADLERFEYEEDTQKLKRLVELRERIWR